MNKKGTYILWLPGWYPNEIEPFAGDFIQRHARAVALYCDVVLIHVIRDPKGTVTKTQKTVVNTTGRLTEITVYYFIKPAMFGAVEKLRSLLRFNSIFKSVLNKLFVEIGHPALCHVHVVNKNAWPARWLQKKYSTRFICSEQWTVYLEEARPNFSQLPRMQRNSIKRLLTEAAGISVVSDYLGKAINKNVAQLSYRVIPNLVDPTIFYPEVSTTNDDVKLIHISNLNYQKNFEDIARACALLKPNYRKFILNVFGPYNDSHIILCKQLGIGEIIHFHGEVDHVELSAWLRKSDGMILYSRYETFGCVYVEAMASGVPVISSNIPVAHEIIEENFSGYFVEGENPKKLAEKIEWFIYDKSETDKDMLVQHATQLYSPEIIGRQFVKWYNEFLTDDLQLKINSKH